MGLYTIARRRINARPAASDVGQRLAAIGTTSAVDGLSIAVYNRRWRNSKSYRRPYRRYPAGVYRLRPSTVATRHTKAPGGRYGYLALAGVYGLASSRRRCVALLPHRATRV